jgi:hypothetical protein
MIANQITQMDFILHTIELLLSLAGFVLVKKIW